MGTHLTLSRVGVDFPVFGQQSMSLRHRIASAATGGRIAYSAGITIIEALRDISIDLQPGCRLGIVGHNGAGKSTLLRVFAGVYEPTRGAISRKGSVSSLIDPMLGIESDATGYENILVRGLMYGIRRQEIKKIVPSIAEFSGLGEYLDMPVYTYSTGMVMRLAFSIVTSFQCDILLMDEWLSVGDSGFQAQAEDRLRSLINNASIVVIASHSRGLLDRECNRIIELTHGMVKSDDHVGPHSRATGVVC